jgi:hypothetical protein
MGEDHKPDARPRVHIIDSHDTADVADEIIRALDRLGVDASAPVPTAMGQVRAVVVLLSARAVRDAVWLRRVELLRGERLVPVRVGALSDEEVPDFLRELNWIEHSRGDQGFLARLFTGINTDASRFRNERATRSLAERWLLAGRSPDFLLESIAEVRSRSEVDADPDAAPQGTVSTEFLTASRSHAKGLRRRRIWRVFSRSGIAIVTVAVLAFTIGTVQEAVRKSNNALSFAIGDSADSSRPDLAAIKAGASLVDSQTYPGSDGRLRIAVDALSQHWPVGYLDVGDSGMSVGTILSDGSIAALSVDGSLWRWSASLDSRSKSPTGVPEILGGDLSPSGDLAIASDGATLAVITPEGDVRTVAGIDDVQQLSLAPANDRALVESDDTLYAINRITSTTPETVSLGAWDSVLDITQTANGSAVALAERDGSLVLVGDDGSTVTVGPTPAGTTTASVSPDGTSIALVADGILWLSTGGPAITSGIVVPGVVLALELAPNGVALVSDRTRGAWAADLGLGVDLGRICQGIAYTTGFTLGVASDRILCRQGAIILVDNLSDIRPAAVAQSTPAPTTTVESSEPTARIQAISLIDGLIRIDRADGMSFALDPAGLSFAPGYKTPAWVDDLAFFGTGALIQAESLPTSVALTPDGSTFAIGFVDGRLVEVDLSEAYSMATVGSWQLPDHSAVADVSWSDDASMIVAVTSTGTSWQRPSCSGCWGELTLVRHIIDRVWLCYADADIAELGATARKAFALRDCESQWDEAS